MIEHLDNLEGNLLFPVFLKIDQFPVLIVGGGNVGLEKLEAMINSNASARITLVSKTIKEEIFALSKAFPSIRLVHRAFVPEDLDGVNLLVLATEDINTNAAIRQMARAKNILTNVADTPALCDFYLGSIVKKGNLKIGISTNGKSPTFAKRLKQILIENLPDDVDELLEKLHNIRLSLKGDFQEKVKRLNAITADLVGKNKSEDK